MLEGLFLTRLSTELLSVNELVIALQMKYPQNDWTAEEFARKIGYSGSAVRKTKAWKIHQKQLENEKQKCPKPKGCKDNRGNLEAFGTDRFEEGSEYEN